MRASRGMGDINPSKMPGKRNIVRKDNPEDVEVYKNGGETKWIGKAIKKPGSLRKQLGIGKDEKIPAKTLEKASKKSGKLGKRARLAMTLEGLK
jgi:hypothetical protein